MEDHMNRRDFLKSTGSMGAPAVLFPISTYDGGFDSSYDLTDIVEKPMNITSEGHIDLDGDGSISEYDARLRRNIPQDLNEALKKAYNLPEPEIYDKIASGEELSNDNEGVLDVKLTYGDIPDDIPEYVGSEFLEPWTNFVVENSRIDVHDEKFDLNESEETPSQVFSEAEELAQEFEDYDILLHLSSHTGNRSDKGNLYGRGHLALEDTPQEFTRTSAVYIGDEWAETEYDTITGSQEALEQITRNQETIPLIAEREEYSKYQPLITIGHELAHNLGFDHEDIEIQSIPTKQGKAALAGAIGGNYSYDAYTYMKHDEEPDNPDVEANYRAMKEIDGGIKKMFHSVTPVGSSLDQEFIYNRN